MALSRMTEEIGRVLGGRYRLIAPIGMGSSAQVFLADDVRLRRRVAVKLLHAGLADDQEFLRRFRGEVQAAAALRHPHLVTVQDWGEGDPPYVVTEFLPGGSLRAMLDRGARLTPSQALQVGLAAARGLEFAHSRGLVHRGLKPSNLLFDDDGRLRIGDFGLARALAEAASTEPSGAVIGTARYASPEQVQGQSLDGRADVYALALILVEAVTGRVPFTADTTIGTLMARVGAPLPVPEELGPLREPLRRAGDPDLDERLDAQGLVTALMAVAGHLPPPGRLPLAGAIDAADADLVERDDPTRVVLPAADRLPTGDDDITYAGPLPVSTATAAASTANGATPSPAVGDEPPSPGPIPRASEPRRSDAAASTAATGAVTATTEPPSATDGASPSALPDPRPSSGPPAPPPEGRRAGERHPGRGAKVAWAVLAVIIVLAAVGAGVVALLASRTPTHALPALVGTNEKAALADLSHLKLQGVVERERRDGTAAGQVLATRPAAGTKLEEGRTVVLVVSEGPTLVKLPTDLAGKPQADAEAELKALGLFLQPPQVVWSEDVEAGRVVGLADGTPDELPKGRTVTLVVSQGPEPRKIPGLDGLDLQGLLGRLTDLGLVPQKVDVFSDAVPAGGIVGVSPAPGASVARGSTVQVQVSKGPELVEVPKINGIHSIDEAVKALEAAGLQAGEAQGRLSGRPRAFDPPSGTKVRKGSSVDIVLR